MRLILGTLAFLFCLSAQASDLPLWAGEWAGSVKYTSSFDDDQHTDTIISLLFGNNQIYVQSEFWDSNSQKLNISNGQISLNDNVVGIYTDTEMSFTINFPDSKCGRDFTVKYQDSSLYYDEVYFCADDQFERFEGLLIPE